MSTRSNENIFVYGNTVYLAKTGEIQLTKDGFEAGAAQVNDTFMLDNSGNPNSISATFSFKISNSGGSSESDHVGADGLTFFLAPKIDHAGDYGNGLGYAGISNESIAIEFDTYQGGSDIDGNHIGLDRKGSVDSDLAVPVAEPLNDGKTWHVWVDYSAEKKLLEVRLSQGTEKPDQPTLTKAIDLHDVLPANTPLYAGFTSGTGGGYGTHSILNHSLTLEDHTTGEGNLVKNGSFENFTTEEDHGSWKASHNVPGWVLESGPQFELHNNQATSDIPDGNYVLDLDASPGNLTISQHVKNMVKSEQYELSFFANFKGRGGDTAEMEVYWGGKLLDTLTSDTNEMKQYTYLIQGGTNDAANTLTFKEIGSEDSEGTFLDDVRIVKSHAAPVPSISVQHVTVPDILTDHAPLSIGYDVVNTGTGLLNGAAQVKVYLSTDSTLSADDVLLNQTTQALNNIGAGQSVHKEIALSDSNLLGKAFGEYHVIVSADVTGERPLHSDLSSDTLTFKPAYTAEVTVPAQPAAAGNHVPLTGQAVDDNGKPVPFVPIMLDVTHNGFVQTYTVRTDAKGQFSYDFISLDGVAGTYDVHAHHPDDGQENAPSVSFNIVDLDIAEAHIDQSVTQGATAHGHLTLTNESNETLTGVSADVSGLPNGWKLDLANMPKTLAAGATYEVDYIAN